MKAVLLVIVSLVAAAHAQTKSYALSPGYDVHTEVNKEGGVFQIKIDPLHTSYWPTANLTGTKVYLRFTPSIGSATTGTATVKMWVDSSASFDPKATTVRTPDKTKAATGLFENFDVEVATADATKTWYLYGLMDCGGCASTGEVKVGLWVVWKTPPAADSVRPFQIHHDGYTADFSVKSKEYSTPGWILVTTEPIYIKLDLFDLSQAGSVIMTYKMGTPQAPGDPDPAATDETATWKKFPRDLYPTGDYSTGPKTLTAGTWFISGYANTVPTGRSSLDFDFAVGIGKEPSASSALMPSVAVLLLSVLAMVAHLL